MQFTLSNKTAKLKIEQRVLDTYARKQRS
jgi:hypothetical protein